MKKTVIHLMMLLVTMAAFTACNKDEDLNGQNGKGQDIVVDADSETTDFHWLDETTFTLNGIKYKLSESDNTNVVVIGYHVVKPTGKLVIPSSIKTQTVTYSVTEIGSEVFEDCEGITSVSLGNNITTIGYRAFRHCSSITEIAWPNKLNVIGQEAFYGCSEISSLAFPDSLTMIKTGAFHGCGALTSVYISSNVSSMEKEYDYGELLGYDEVDGYDHNVAGYIIDEFFPDVDGVGVSWDGANPFMGCENLTSIKVDGKNKFYDSRNNCNAIIRTSDNLLISGCQNTTIPNGVKTIGKYAFYGCKELTSIVIPNSVTKIEKGAFRNCESLSEIILSDGLKEIGQYAFYNCQALNSINIPESVETIAYGAFYNCKSLKSISIPNSVKRLGVHCFSDCSDLVSVILPEELDVIRMNTFAGCSQLSQIKIPEKVEIIGSGAFEGCRQLKDVDLPQALLAIGMNTFSNCSSLTTIVFPQNVKFIGPATYEACPNISSVTIHNPVPPTLYDRIFDEKIYRDATLYVPHNAIKAYSNDHYWGLFQNIQGIGEGNNNSGDENGNGNDGNNNGDDEYDNGTVDWGGDWEPVTENYSQHTRFRTIRVRNKQCNTPEYSCVFFSKDGNLVLSRGASMTQSADASSDTYYNINFYSLTIGDNQPQGPNGINISSCKSVGNGWYEYEFSTELYFSHYQQNAPKNQLWVMPLSGGTR